MMMARNILMMLWLLLDITWLREVFQTHVHGTIRDLRERGESQGCREIKENLEIKASGETEELRGQRETGVMVERLDYKASKETEVIVVQVDILVFRDPREQRIYW